MAHSLRVLEQGPGAPEDGTVRMKVKERWGQFKEFLTDVRKEVGKVSWPAKDEVIGTTTVVIITCAIVGVYLFAVDAVVTPLVNKLFSAFGS